MKLIIIQSIILIFVSSIYAEVMPSERYDLKQEEIVKLHKLLIFDGYREETKSIVADKHDNGNILINVKLKPVSKKKYKEMTCFSVDYAKGQMKITHKARMICYDSTDFYFSVASDVNDSTISKAVERYLSIKKHKEFSFIKLGRIRCLYKQDDSYVLSIVISEDTRYAFTLILDKNNPSNIKNIKIEPLPI